MALTQTQIRSLLRSAFINPAIDPEAKTALKSLADEPFIRDQIGVKTLDEIKAEFEVFLNSDPSTWTAALVSKWVWFAAQNWGTFTA